MNVIKRVLKRVLIITLIAGIGYASYLFVGTTDMFKKSYQAATEIVPTLSEKQKRLAEIREDPAFEKRMEVLAEFIYLEEQELEATIELKKAEAAFNDRMLEIQTRSQEVAKSLCQLVKNASEQEIRYYFQTTNDMPVAALELMGECDA